jgi:serine/threonine protein kinase
MIGQVFLQYRIVEKIGEGAQGTVYRAIDTTLEPAFKNLGSEAKFIELSKSIGLPTN